jgi:hypothetical protein
MNHSIFFGNGLNLINEDTPDWQDLLNDIDMVSANKKHLPYSMIYELLYQAEKIKTCDESIDHEFIIKERIAKKLKDQRSNFAYKKIKSFNVKNFITTNYDYAFCNELESLAQEDKSEDLYSIRRHKRYDDGTKLWFIHGEISKPKSIMLGLDHYCGSIGKIDSYLKGSYALSKNGESNQKVEKMNLKIENSKFDELSWIELFFNTHLHIIGFGLDYVESDIWWLLNKRARYTKCNTIKNKIFYYAIDDDKMIESDREKHELLKALNVEVQAVPLLNSNYKNSYAELLQLMSENITKN